LEVVADTLMDDPRVAPGIFPRVLEKHGIMNVLHVLSCILMALMLSLSISIHNGGFQMTWSFDADKNAEYFRSLDPAKIQELLRGVLEEIDFEVVQEEALKAMQQQQQQQSPNLRFHYYGEEAMFEMAYKIMLIMFSLFHNSTECRFMGRSVRQRFVKPKRTEPEPPP
jgi:hypothetical protein